MRTYFPTVAALAGDEPTTRYEAAVAERLRVSITPDLLDTLRQALKQHLTGRINEMERDLTFSRESLSFFETWKPADLLRMAQMLAETERQNKLPQLTLEQMRGRKLPYRMSDFQRWREEIGKLDGLTNRNSLLPRSHGLRMS